MAQGVYTDMVSSWVNSNTGASGNGGYCSGRIEWNSSWKYGNTHSLTLVVIGIRTDGYGSASMWGDAIVNGEYKTLGDHKVGSEPSFDEVSFDVETDDYGRITTDVRVSIGFYSSNANSEYWANANLTGMAIDKPPKDVNIDCPEGIVCTINKSPLYVDDQFVITVTVTGLQWSDSPIISVTGATKVKDLTYKATGDVYIVITGVLAQHSIHIIKDAGMNVTVKDASTGYMYGDGSVVDHYTVIKVECSPKPGYKFNRLTINGAKQNSGVSVEVTSDVNIIAMSNALGMARIHTGTKFEPFHIFIFNGASWNMYIPLVYDGVSWNICA